MESTGQHGSAEWHINTRLGLLLQWSWRPRCPLCQECIQQRLAYAAELAAAVEAALQVLLASLGVAGSGLGFDVR